jgi:hypothetical protein
MYASRRIRSSHEFAAHNGDTLTASERLIARATTCIYRQETDHGGDTAERTLGSVAIDWLNLLCSYVSRLLETASMRA